MERGLLAGINTEEQSIITLFLSQFYELFLDISRWKGDGDDIYGRVKPCFIWFDYNTEDRHYFFYLFKFKVNMKFRKKD